MIGVVVKVLVGLMLFAGSLVGGLAATGRLNHEGTANIPLLRSFFPAPPDGGAGDGAHGGASEGAEGAHGENAEASPGAGESPSNDAVHADAANEAGETTPRRQLTGPSLYARGNGGEEGGESGEVEQPADKPAHDKPATDKAAPRNAAHGKLSGSAHAPVEAGKAERAKPEPRADKRGLPESDFQHLEKQLANGREHYTPGELFRFQGLPAGVTAEQINDAWQRVQAQLQELERRKLVLDQQEQQQRELSEDVSRRQGALGKERVRIEQMQRDLDAKIRKFEEQVKLVRSDEVAALKRNAQTIASFEPDKAIALLEAQWKTDKGQDEVLKLLEFMDKDAVNEIIKGLPTATQQDLLKKRLRVVKEPAASGKGN
jgi:hypothetical protein